MKNFKVCTRCKGTKTINSLGFMLSECDQCKGIGYVDKQDEPVVHKANTINDLVKITKVAKKRKKIKKKKPVINVTVEQHLEYLRHQAFNDKEEVNESI